MAGKKVARPSEIHLCQVRNDLAEVKEGLGRICAVAELLQFTDPEDHVDLDTTLERAAEMIVREAEGLRGAVDEISEKLVARDKQDATARGARLEVVNG